LHLGMRLSTASIPVLEIGCWHVGHNSGNNESTIAPLTRSIFHFFAICSRLVLALSSFITATSYSRCCFGGCLVSFQTNVFLGFAFVCF
jgi:hypothetical protein